MDNEKVEIFVVDCSYGVLRICSIKAIEKGKTYVIDRSTQVDYFGRQFFGKILRKETNDIFPSAKEAVVFASAQLAEYIDDKQKKLNEARDQLQELYKMLGKL